MKKTIGFVMALIVVVLLGFGIFSWLNPHRESKVSVHHEWGALKEVILGSGENLIIPKLPVGTKAPETETADFLLPLCAKYGGKKYAEVNPESAQRVIAQMDNLAKVLESRGVKVHRVNHLEPEEEEFIIVGNSFIFPRDPILVIGNNIIEASMRATFRRKEKFAIRPYIKKFITDPDVNYVSIPQASPHLNEEGPYIEGGDVLLNGDEIYVGNSGVATNRAAIDWLQKYLGPKYKVREIKLQNTVLHLDCALSLLKPGLGLLYKEAIVGDLPASLKNWDLILVTSAEAAKLGANVFVLDDKTVIVDSQHQRIAQEIRKRGQEVIEVPYDEVAKFGGAFRCSHHPLLRD